MDPSVGKLKKKKKMKIKINVAKMRMLRLVTVRNTRRLDVTNVDGKMKENLLKWFGHTLREEIMKI